MDSSQSPRTSDYADGSSNPHEDSGYVDSFDWSDDVLAQVLALKLEEYCHNNERIVNKKSTCSDFTTFFSQNKQPFDLEFYMTRLVQYANCSSTAFVIMLVYLDRLQANRRELLLTDMNCHRVVLTALVLAVKYLEDEVFSNCHYASVGGITCKEMNTLEACMLDVLNWDLFVSPETFLAYESGLSYAAKRMFVSS